MDCAKFHGIQAQENQEVGLPPFWIMPDARLYVILARSCAVQMAMPGGVRTNKLPGSSHSALVISLWHSQAAWHSVWEPVHKWIIKRGK